MSTGSLDAEVRSLVPPTEFSRRGFLTTSSIAGFTLATVRTWFQQNGVAS